MLLQGLVSLEVTIRACYEELRFTEKNGAETIFTHKVLVNFTNSYNIVAETPTFEIKKGKNK